MLLFYIFSIQETELFRTSMTKRTFCSTVEKRCRISINDSRYRRYLGIKNIDIISIFEIVISTRH